MRFNDILALVGLLWIHYGLWQIYEPLAWIFSGSVVVAIVVSVNKERANKKSNPE